MTKNLKSISISERIADDITNRIKKGFNFSHWVEKAYIKEFLSEQTINNKIINHEKAIKKLTDELKDLTNKEIDYYVGFTEQEKRFLVDSAIKVKNGYDIRALNKVFNNTFNRELELYDFKIAMDYFDEKVNKK